MARKVSKGKKPTETMRQRQQRLLREQRARKAAASKPVKAKPSTPSSTRVEKVKVKVEPQKKLPPSKTTKALPPGKKGGPVSTGNRPRRRNINTNPSSNVTRTGSQSRSAAAREVQAVRRAGTQSRNPGIGGKGGLLSALGAGELVGALMNEFLPRKATPSGRGTGRATDRVTPGPSNRTARQQAEETKTKPRSRGMSNIPPSEGSRNNPNYGKPGKPNSANKPTRKPTPAPKYTPPKGKATVTPKPKPKAASASDARSLRSGPTPPKPKKTSPKTESRKYGVKDGNNAKGRSKRLMSALKDLKVRKYKK
jgi:hypothetical protein